MWVDTPKYDIICNIIKYTSECGKINKKVINDEAFIASEMRCLKSFLRPIKIFHLFYSFIILLSTDSERVFFKNVAN